MFCLNLCCKADVLMLNPLYEIFTCNIVGRELWLFMWTYSEKVSQCAFLCVCVFVASECPHLFITEWLRGCLCSVSWYMFINKHNQFQSKAVA